MMKNQLVRFSYGKFIHAIWLAGEPLEERKAKLNHCLFQEEGVLGVVII